MRNKSKTDRLIRIPAAIKKEELEQAAPMYGATNAGQFGGHPAGTLRLKTFAGKYDLLAKFFVGEYCFEPTDKVSDQVFTDLPGLEGKRLAPQDGGRRKKSSATEESVNHG